MIDTAMILILTLQIAICVEKSVDCYVLGNVEKQFGLFDVFSVVVVLTGLVVRMHVVVVGDAVLIVIGFAVHEGGQFYGAGPRTAGAV